MRLEVPAPGHHTVMQGETWADLSVAWLGMKDDARDRELLARVNKGVPWVPPVEGQEIEMPADRHVHRGGRRDDQRDRRTLLGRPEPRLGAQSLQPSRGRPRAARRSRPRADDAAEADRRRSQRGAVRGGARRRERRHGARATAQGRRRSAAASRRRPLRSLCRGHRARQPRRSGGAALTHPQLAIVHRALLEAYVAIDARASAAAACAAWKSNEPNPVLDPVRVSPKIRDACAAH